MWPFDRPTNGDLAERIDYLEDRIDDYRDELNSVRTELRETEGQLDDVERQQQGLIEAMNKVAVDEVPDRKVPQKVDTVYTLHNDCVGYKTTENEVATLVLPEGTRVVYASSCDWDSPYSTKLRADQAIVARLEHPRHARYRDSSVNSTDNVDVSFRRVQDESQWDPNFTYTVGEVVTPDNVFDPTTSEHCAGGIHFYRTLEEAI
jgi:hypothetical protein